VQWIDDSNRFVANALAPAKVKEVRVDPETSTAQVIVPDYQLSLAIGKEGQNARLAAKLTGFRIDIKSETQAAEEERGRREARQAASAEPEAEAPAEPEPATAPAEPEPQAAEPVEAPETEKPEEAEPEPPTADLMSEAGPDADASAEGSVPEASTSK
jgi:N utilization substance protein A